MADRSHPGVLIFVGLVGIMLATSCGTRSRRDSAAVSDSANKPVATETVHVSVGACAEFKEGAEGIVLRSWTLCHPIVAIGAWTDTLAGVWMEGPPHVRGDSVVQGVAVDTDAVATGLFEYSLPHSRLRIRALPPDFSPVMYELALSPDGRYYLYISYSGNNGALALVREWASGATVYQSPNVPVMGTDVPGDYLSWTDATHFEVVIQTENNFDHPDDTIWVRFRGQVNPLVVVTDTVFRRDVPPALPN